MGATVKPTVIQATECIGNSLYTINTNFARLYTGISLLESFQGKSTFNGMVKSTTSLGLTAAVAGVDYAPGTASLGSGLVKTVNGTLSKAVSSVDYFVPGSSLNASNVTFSGQLSGVGSAKLGATTIVGTLSVSDRAFLGSGGNIINGTQTFILGDVEATGKIKALDFVKSSDARLKQDITEIKYPLTKLEQIRGVTFTWKSSLSTDVGVIAQEVEKVLPEAVSEGPLHDSAGEQRKFVSYDKLIPLLIESVKELKAEVDYLRSKMNLY